MRDILVAGMIAEAGKVDSRVKLQKMVYLLQRMGFDFGFYDFSLRDFGPFSADLAAAVDSASEGMVEEKQDKKSNRYTYEARSTLKPLLYEILKTLFRKEMKKLQHLTQKLSGQPTRVLEVAATALYLRDEVGIRDQARLWQEVQNRKSHLSDYSSVAAEAKRLLSEWDKQGLLRK